MINTRLFKEFFESEKSGGLVLIACTLISVLLTNSNLGTNYHDFWKMNLGGYPLEFWINDGLMTLFFLLIGLELKREMYQGELSNWREALLPIFGALGGMLVPASLFLVLNFGTATQSGAGIPMATDIAFALGVLSLLGKKVPIALKVFLTALAVIDDLGAILVIALFYTKTLIVFNLLIAASIFIVLLFLNRINIKSLPLYLIGGFAMWYFMLDSGVHATITGVVVAFAIPFGKGKSQTASHILQHFLHRPVAFFILPIFALANTAIYFTNEFRVALSENYGIGIALGLLLGKPLGIFTLSYFSVALGWCKLPENLNWHSILGAGYLGGIGFTMSIFITLLAFEDATLVNNSKLIVLISSFVAGTIGYFYLKRILK